MQIGGALDLLRDRLVERFRRLIRESRGFTGCGGRDGAGVILQLNDSSRFKIFFKK